MTVSKIIRRLPKLAIAILMVFAFSAILVEHTLADPVVKLQGEGSIAVLEDSPALLILTGNGSHLGKYDCYGEIDFSQSEDSETTDGLGVAVIRAANGDMLVGVIALQIDDQGNGVITFSWRDSIQLSDGSVVSNSGRFVKSRPAGAVSRFSSISDGTSNIIAILIG